MGSYGVPDVVYRRATATEGWVLAELRWESVARDTRPLQSQQDFLDEFVSWFSTHEATHVPFVATQGDEYLGVAWLAIGERVPAPDEPVRLTGDVQSVYVREARRGVGVGAGLLAAVVAYARGHGLMFLTVLSSVRATTLYERGGFQSSPELLMMTLPTSHQTEDVGAP